LIEFDQRGISQNSHTALATHAVNGEHYPERNHDNETANQPAHPHSENAQTLVEKVFLAFLNPKDQLD